MAGKVAFELGRNFAQQIEDFYYKLTNEERKEFLDGMRTIAGCKSMSGYRVSEELETTGKGYPSPVRVSKLTGEKELVGAYDPCV